MSATIYFQVQYLVVKKEELSQDKVDKQTNNVLEISVYGNLKMNSLYLCILLDSEL